MWQFLAVALMLLYVHVLQLQGMVALLCLLVDTYDAVRVLHFIFY
jgi:hypothetical protein